VYDGSFPGEGLLFLLYVLIQNHEGANTKKKGSRVCLSWWEALYKHKMGLFSPVPTRLVPPFVPLVLALLTIIPFCFIGPTFCCCSSWPLFCVRLCLGVLVLASSFRLVLVLYHRTTAVYEVGVGFGVFESVVHAR
jgi:hypothetical protein